MWAQRITTIIILGWSAACLALAGYIFYLFPSAESPERYLALVLGLAMLYMGGSLLVSLFWPAKPKDPNAPIAIPPLSEVHGRTSYRDNRAKWRNVQIVIGAILLVISVTAGAEQPAVLVFALIALGVLAGACVQIWRQILYGRARLELAAPARRGDAMQGTITMSGAGWLAVDEEFALAVELSAVPGGKSSAVEPEPVYGITNATRDGKDMTIRFSMSIPVVDTSECQYTWNLVLETESPAYIATFIIDVA